MLGGNCCDMTTLSTFSSSRKKSGLSMKSSAPKLYSVSVRVRLSLAAFARVEAAEIRFISSSDSISIIVVVRVSGEKIPFFISCDAVTSGLGLMKNRDFSAVVSPFEGGFLGAFRFRDVLLSFGGFGGPGWGCPRALGGGLRFCSLYAASSALSSTGNLWERSISCERRS